MNREERTFRSKLLGPLAALALAAALVAGVLKGGLIAQAQDDTETGLTVGEAAVVIDGRLNLRSDAGLASDVLTILPDATFVTITDGPVTADDYDWYAVDVDGTAGWVAGDFLAPAASDGVLPVDTTVIVNTDTLNLREASGLDAAVVTTLSTDTAATVLAGPETVDGYDWYQLDVDGTTGWAVRDFLAFGEATTTDTTETTDTTDTTDATDATAFAAGDAVVVTDGTLNLRSEAGLVGELVDVLPDGAAATVVDGPVESDGYSWYQVTTDLGDGWVAGEFLLAA